jgi:hypothetical protein
MFRTVLLQTFFLRFECDFNALKALLLRWNEVGGWDTSLRQIRYWREQKNEMTKNTAVINTDTGQYGTVLVFRQKFALEDTIGSHACSPLQASMRVTNSIPLGRVATTSYRYHHNLCPNTEGLLNYCGWWRTARLLTINPVTTLMTSHHTEGLLNYYGYALFFYHTISAYDAPLYSHP